MTLMVMYQEKGDEDKARLMEEKIATINKKLNK
jgi:hypothetical protein